MVAFEDVQALNAKLMSLLLLKQQPRLSVFWGELDSKPLEHDAQHEVAW